MPVKQVFIPHLGRHVKLGRKPPVAHGFRVQFGNYLRRKDLPPPPGNVNYSTGSAAPAIAQMYLNDQLGDCVIAGGYHIIGMETGDANGQPFIASDQQITADYSAIGGYVPGNPATDNGANLTDAMNYWTQKGFADGSKLVGWCAVDPSNQMESMQAAYLLENLYIGGALPDSWLNNATPGAVWDVDTPDPNNGHCVAIVGYSSQGVLVSTWGMVVTMTWAAYASFCSPANNGESYVLLSPDQISAGTQKAPNGIDWNTLVADFQALGGGANPPPLPPAPPAPPGPPTPPAPPAPPAGVTLDQAIAWSTQGLADNWPSAQGKKKP
jgi:hypothetical protein